MRNAYEINAYLARDDANKWLLKNDEAVTITKFQIVKLNISDDRRGCVLATAGGNADASTALFYVQQDVKAGAKVNCFRTGFIDYATGAAAVDAPVYLSDSTAGGLTFTAPAVPVVIGHVLEQDVIFLDLAAGGAAPAVATTHLDTHEYWVNGDDADIDYRQFDTVTKAVTQALADVPPGSTVVINLAAGQTHTLPAGTLTGYNWVFRGPGTVLDLNGAAFSQAAVIFHRVALTGTLTVNTACTVTLLEVRGAAAELSVALGAGHTATVDILSSTGSIAVVQPSAGAGAMLALTAKGCAFNTDGGTPTNVDLLACTAVFQDCSFFAQGGAGPLFTYDSTNGVVAVILVGCRTTGYGVALTADANVSQPNPPVFYITGGYLTVLSLGTVCHGIGLPLIDVGDRSGAVAGADLFDSRRPTYEAGRSVAVYSEQIGALLGHPNVIEFTYTVPDADEAIDGVNPTDGAVEIYVPAGEVWRVTTHRTAKNGTTLFSDKRHHVLWNNAGTISITSSAATDPYPVGTQVGQVAIVAGVGGGTFRVQSVSAAGWGCHVTLEIEDAMTKGGW